MRSPRLASATSVISLALSLGAAGHAWAQSSVLSPSHDEASVTTHATGTFDVTLTPQTTVHSATNLGRMSIEKHFHGDLEGTSRGEMLTAMTDVPGSAGYVAIEQVSGTLHGRRGTFVLQHSGVVAHGTQQLRITVVPDSGTDDLAGLAGTMTITITDGKHAYDFEYTIGTSD